MVGVGLEDALQTVLLLHSADAAGVCCRTAKIMIPRDDVPGFLNSFQELLLLVIERQALNEMLTGSADLAELATSGRLKVEGDGEKLGELLGLLDEPDPGFAIVTPEA